ncbi:MAG: hypothetical protein Q4G38_05040, partial [Aeriscardovia aeriphila]|nr:hypothetical protein [Aeriscardovia aeriphila]
MALPVFADQATHSPDSQHNDALQAHFQYGEVTDPNAPHWGPAEPSRTRKHAPRALLQRRAQSDGETTPSWKEV